MISRNIAATSWALHARGITPTAWKVLMVMAHMVNNKRQDFDVWPKQQTLADACDMPISTLKRHINELDEKGFLIRRPRMKKSGGVAGCTYTLNVKATFEMPSGSVRYDFADEEQDEDEAGEPLAQYERARSPRDERARSTTGERAIEPLNPEPLNLPPSLREGPPPEDLFGEPMSESTALVVVHNRGSIIDHVAEGWKRLHDDHRRIPNVRVFSDSRKKAIVRRAAEVVHASDGALDAYQVWDMIFAAIRADRWLRGDADPGRGHDRAFVVEIDHVLRTRGNPNFISILERAATSEHDDRTSTDARTGRRYGPAELSARAAIARIQSGDE